MAEVDDETKGLEKIQGEFRNVAIRMRRLIAALGLNKTKFAAASKGGFGPDESPLGRVEVTDATNGKQLAQTDRWTRGIAFAAGVDQATAADYVRGRIELADLMKRRAEGSVRRHDVVSRGPAASDLSPNALVAMSVFDWNEVDRATYDYVHDAIAAEHQAGGRDPVPSFWTSRITSHLRDARGKAAKDVSRPSADAAEARDDADLSAHKSAKSKRK